jgi:redox-sensitive bicupin YhaK (pirin superfamily)
MITIRKSKDRGHADRGWLKGYYSFSFADYNDPEHMNFSVLRVLNDDRIAPGKGFGPHAHRDMEIITYVLEGGLLHRDSTGESHILRPNEVQTMSAGSGIVHSEFNASENDPTHSIQIWITPAAEDLQPSYQQIAFSPSEKRGRFRLLAGPQARASEQATVINQNAELYVSELARGEYISHGLARGRQAWIQIVRGNVSLNGNDLQDGDGAGVCEERELVFAGTGAAGGEVLLFDLP